MNNLILDCPNKPGVWKHIDSNTDLDIYELEPMNNVLCIWGPDVGITNTTQSTDSYKEQDVFYDTKWQGHISIKFYAEKLTTGKWLFLKDF